MQGYFLCNISPCRCSAPFYCHVAIGNGRKQTIVVFSKRKSYGFFCFNTSFLSGKRITQQNKTISSRADFLSRSNLYLNIILNNKYSCVRYTQHNVDKSTFASARLYYKRSAGYLIKTGLRSVYCLCLLSISIPVSQFIRLVTFSFQSNLQFINIIVIQLVDLDSSNSQTILYLTVERNDFFSSSLGNFCYPEPSIIV